jgi:putative transcriptional regulator
MNQSRFDELCQALRQAGAAQKGEAAPSRVWEIKRDKNGKITRRELDPESYRRDQLTQRGVLAIRVRLGLSQEKFAAMLGISVKTLHNWEQGRRKPTGPARVLLRIASRHPEAVLDAAA